MNSLAQLETHANELATAVKTLTAYSRSADIQQDSSHQPFIAPEALNEVRRAKRSILSTLAKIRTLICGPTDLLEHLAGQTELLACLRWLGEFQILACIPLDGSVLIQDVVGLSGVPEQHLGRIIRLTATAGFLHEPEPGHVAHTPLSAPFVANPSFLDAAMFLAESAGPAALQMAPATRRFGSSHSPSHSAYNLALSTEKPFHAACKEQPKLNRQWAAYLRHAGGSQVADNIADILTHLNWPNLGSACIVEMGAQSTSTARSLVDLYPALHVVVQINDPASTTPNQPTPPSGARDGTDTEPRLNSRITVQNRVLGTRQTVTDAAVYILHLTVPSPNTVLAELQFHLGILRASNGVMLILTARLLPEPRTLDPDIEAIARSRDLTLLQLAHEGEMEMAEILGTIDRVRDNVGKLVVANKLRSRNGIVVALVVKYQVCGNCSPELQSI